MTSDNTPYASAWSRTWANAIDTVLFVFVYLALELAIQDAYHQNCVYYALVTAYYVAFEASPMQATLGKKMLGIYVAMCGDKRASFVTIAWRYFLLMIPVIPVIWIMLGTNLFEIIDLGSGMSETESHAYLQKPEVIGLFIVFGISVFGGFLVSVFVSGLPMFFTKEHINLHDWLSKTRVYKRPKQVPAS